MKANFKTLFNFLKPKNQKNSNFKEKENNSNLFIFDNDQKIIEDDAKFNELTQIEFDLEETMKPISKVPSSKNFTFKVSCKSKLNHNLKYEWYKLTSKNSADYELIDNHNLHYLNLSEHEVIKNDGFVYKCKIIDTISQKHCEITSILKVIYPELEIIQKPFLTTVLKLNNSVELNIKAVIKNREVNPDWKLEYQWFIFKNSKWLELEDDNNFSGSKSSALKVEKVNSLLLGSILSCKLKIKNSFLDDDFLTNNFQIKLTSQIPEITNIEIVSDDLSPENRYVFDGEPILKADIKLNGYNQLPFGYTYTYKWFEWKNNSWTLAEYKNEYKLVKQINSSFGDTKIKCNVQIIDFQHNIVSNYTSEPITIKSNPNIYINNAWRKINILNNQEITISTNPVTRISQNKIQYNWYLNGEIIDKDDQKYQGQNSPKLTIRKASSFNNGEYRLAVIVNQLRYFDEIPKTELTVFNNPPRIENVNYDEEIKVNEVNKKFVVSISSYPTVDYEIALTQFKFTWLIKDKFDEYVSLENTEGINGANSPTITFKRFPSDRTEIFLKLRIQYVDIKNPKTIYSTYWTNPIKIYK